MAALLDRLPAVPFSEPSIPVSYADVAAQLAAVGVAAPTAGADQAASARFWDAAQWLWLPSSLSYSADPAWRAAFGFDLFQIDQAIGLNVRRPDREQDFRVTLVRGRFAEAEVRAAWTRSGYQAIEVEGGELASVGEEALLDPALPFFQLSAFDLANAAILADGTLGFAGTREDLAAVLDVAAGRAPSLADRVDVAALVRAARPDLVTAVLATGSQIQAEDPLAMFLGDGTPGVPDIGAIATALATEIAAPPAMSPIALGLLGMTAGFPPPATESGEGTATPGPSPPGQPAARGEIALLMPSPGAAAAAVPVVEGRLAGEASRTARRPYAELFPERVVRAVPGEPVLLVDLGLGEGVPAGVLSGLLVAADLGFLAR